MGGLADFVEGFASGAYFESLADQGDEIRIGNPVVGDVGLAIAPAGQLNRLTGETARGVPGMAPYWVTRWESGKGRA
jgi:hypothetical protein